MVSLLNVIISLSSMTEFIIGDIAMHIITLHTIKKPNMYSLLRTPVKLYYKRIDCHNSFVCRNSNHESSFFQFITQSLLCLLQVFCKSYDHQPAFGVHDLRTQSILYSCYDTPLQPHMNYTKHKIPQFQNNNTEIIK